MLQCVGSYPTFFRSIFGVNIPLLPHFQIWKLEGPSKLFWALCKLNHYVKSVRIRSYSGPHFSRIFLHLDWIRRDTPYLSVFSPNAWKCRINSDQNNSEYGYFLCMLNHSQLFVMRCAIWYHLYNIKNVKNIHGAVLLLGNFTKSNTTPWVFFTFLNCTNGTKSSAFRSTFCRNVPRKMKWFRPGRE